VKLSGGYRLGPAELLLGGFDFGQAYEVVKLRRDEQKSKFVDALAVFFHQKNSGIRSEKSPLRAALDRNSNTLMLLRVLEEESRQNSNAVPIQSIDGHFDLPEELVALARDIIKDIGSIPEAYVQTAAGLAGGGINRQESVMEEDIVTKAIGTAFRYDEWDYRRGGYREAWCSLYEKTVDPVGSHFITLTLEKYRSQHKQLLRQFAMLRPIRRIVRRRRHGDDIDLDALIEALCDTRAGFTPSDRLFIRSLRIARDITTLFLVDMSNSTEGWISIALKEALVLLAEALEAAGDRYGIYGFSGMRRSRCELYHIKHPEETYGETVKRRIAAIMPREYTRMGPPIRHLTKMLLNCPSKIHLLVVISDGKPEDYDDYKGQYAIEDTRKALLEARGRGVHSFCITIDKDAHEYLSHMFGRGNYIFVNNVLTLPTKMADMYRLLTG
jgi:nitric oxide reductase NorD protein